MDCQAKPPRKPHRPQRRIKNPDGSLRAVKDRTDLAAVQAVYGERAQVETRRKMAEFRAATPNGSRLLHYSQQTHSATQRMLADLHAQIMVLEHLAQVQRRDMEATLSALADRVARLEG
jgi:hypothetical protein